MADTLSLCFRHHRLSSYNYNNSNKMDISLIEEQLNDLLEVLGCPEKKARAPPTRRCSESALTSLMTPLERIVKTKPIWYLPDVTREESVKLLANKKTGNFIIRGSRQPQTLAISLRLKDRPDFPPVQHFIVLVRAGKVALEDSDLLFDNIVSLAFHYTQVCDELPERLTLPDVLATASSLQNIVSLSLLGKSFWSYPMARSGRMSVFLCEAAEASRARTEETQEEADQARLTRTPPRPPARSRAQPQPQAPARQKTRRNSDSVPFIISPARVAARPTRHSMGDLQDSRHGWVNSPVFSGSGRHSPPLSNTRARKVSVFYNQLGHVDEESDDGQEAAEITEDSDYSDLPKTDEEEADYAFPLDAISEENDNSIYENPEEPVRKTDGMKCDDKSSLMTGGSVIDSGGLHQPRSARGDGRNTSDRVDKSELSDDGGDSFIECPQSPPPVTGDKRKLSLGIILRKLSTGSHVGQQNKERKSSLQEKRLSSAITKLITLPIFERRTLGESYQVNSLSWEFLNKDADDECWERSGDKSKHLDDKKKIDVKMPLEKHPSMDSLYESEFDSSSTMESSVSSSSGMNKKVAPVSN